MDSFTTLTGIAAPMPQINVDTDLDLYAAGRTFRLGYSPSGLGEYARCAFVLAKGRLRFTSEDEGDES